MKALTVRPPWGAAILDLGKDIENRSWRTRYRGPLAIHTSWNATQLAVTAALDWMRDRGLWTPGLVPPWTMDDPDHRGRVIGTVELVDVVRDHPSPWAMDGQWHWVLARPQRLEPSPLVSGRLGVWEWTP